MPAVILSAASDSEARIKRLGPNAPLLLQKPIRRETMLSAIRTVLEKSGQQI
jgi:DNA-binding response OmpR family regulator